MFPGMEPLQQYTAREESFARRFYNGGDQGSIQRIDAPGYFLLTASHATNHWIGNHRKFAHPFTGAMARSVAEASGQSFLAPDGSVGDWSWWDERHDPYKTALDESLAAGKFVLDLHGVAAKYGADMFIGLGINPTEEALELADLIQDAFAGFTVVAGGRFNATASTTVRSYVREADGDGLQLDLAPMLRDPSLHPETTLECITRLGTALNAHAASRTVPTALAA